MNLMMPDKGVQLMEEARFDAVREIVQEVENTSYEGIQQLAMASTEGLNEADLRGRLDIIRRLLVYRDGARDILSDCLTGNLEMNSALHALETLKYQSLGLVGEDDVRTD